ncbi:TPA: restriction endonuclease subunit S [Haemophilus influenzae]|uniref:restriction endonuclease subunit S n=1 Tax=Haemophilus influenzae TaxID=727 RepID=UPI000DD330F5|nr:restriction endonuclease subunit S [Haemophilus influenzae]
MKNNRTFLEKLLDGAEVEWKTVKSLCNDNFWLMPATPEFDDNGTIPYITSKNIKGGKIDFQNTKYINKHVYQELSRTRCIIENDILISMIGTIGEAVIVKKEDLFFYGQNMYILRLNNKLVNYKFFLYYFTAPFILNSLLSKKNSSNQGYLKAGQIENLKIPIPPLSVQIEIVKILDALTALTSELTSELILRQKQYEYYREKLLNIDEMNKVTELGDVGPVRMCKRILKNQTANSGDIPFYKIGTFGKKPDAYISNELFQEYKQKYSYPKKGDILISASGTIGRTVIFDGENSYFQDSNIVWIDNDETLVLNKYLYHFYKIAKWGIAEGGTIQRLYNDNLKKVKISIPPLKEQHRIVSILDKFETLTNSITEGLPLAIEQSQKRYEYYRELLLNFHNP